MKYEEIVKKLEDKGWMVLDPKDDAKYLGPRIVSQISNWNELQWAQKTYYSAKYDFNAQGELSIPFAVMLTPYYKDLLYSKTNKNNVVVPR